MQRSSIALATCCPHQWLLISSLPSDSNLVDMQVLIAVDYMERMEEAERLKKGKQKQAAKKERTIK